MRTLAALLALATPAGAQTVGLWDRFETSVTNTRAYRDPYGDVSLDVTYTRPNGSTVRFWGFYDGGTTWKLRFMPDQVGTWRYQATFSDGAAGKSGSFECIASTLPGMISRDETNPMWFGFRGGRHVLVRSFHVGDRFFAMNWDDPANPNDGNPRKAFLDWAQQQGYNMLSVASHYLNRNVAGRGAGWDTPDLWPLNAGEYRELETILNDLAARRMMVYPFAGFFGRSSDFPRDAAGQSRFIRYTLARLGPYWNVLLNVAGPEPLLDNYLTVSDIDRLGSEIRSRDIFGHLLSVHNQTGDDPFRDRAWLSYGTLQGPKTTSLSTLSAGLLRNHHPSKPLFAQETLWSGNQHHPNYTDAQLRKNAYVILMSAAALNFGDMDPNLSDGAQGNSSSGFSGTMDLSQRLQGRHDILRRVWDFFETLPFYRMSPRQDLVTAGYALAEPGRSYLVYLPSRGTVSVTVTGGPYAVQWINAQNPSDRRSGPNTADGRNLTSPSDGDDWLVYLTPSSGTPSPGPAVASFTLINADADAPVAGFDPLNDGATLNLGTLPTRRLNIRANTSPPTVGSVRFGYDGNSNYQIENGAPYALAGNSGTDYFPWTPSVGSHAVTATPYTGANATGAAGTPKTIRFTVIDDPSSPSSNGAPSGAGKEQDAIVEPETELSEEPRGSESDGSSGCGATGAEAALILALCALVRRTSRSKGGGW